MKTLYAILAVLVLCGATYQDKGAVIVRRNDNGTVSTIPKRTCNPDYVAYLQSIGKAPAVKVDVKANEITALKSAVKALSEGKPVAASDMAVIAPVVKPSDIGTPVTGPAVVK